MTATWLGVLHYRQSNILNNLLSINHISVSNNVFIKNFECNRKEEKVEWCVIIILHKIKVFDLMKYSIQMKYLTEQCA